MPAATNRATGRPTAQHDSVQAQMVDALRAEEVAQMAALPPPTKPEPVADDVQISVTISAYR